MSYYAFPTEAQAVAALAAAEAEIRVVAVEKGFTVTPEGAVVGKNAANGQDMPGAVTTKWADVMQFTDGTWGFPSVRQGFPTTWLRIEAAAILSDPVLKDLPEVADGE